MSRYNLTRKWLADHFEEGWRKFYSEKEAPFSDFYKGPSLHFHVRTINKIRASLQTPRSTYKDVCKDTDYLELLYATLTAWGMDRMGGGQKLQCFETFKVSLQDDSFIRCLDSLKDTPLSGLGDISEIEQQVRLAYDWLRGQERVMKTGKTLVGVAKTLHHMLPDLLIPVDRKYIIGLLNYLNKKEFRPSKYGDSFENYWKCISISHYLCQQNGLSNIDPTEEYPMNTSIPKLIDNSLIGIFFIHQKKRKRRVKNTRRLHGGSAKTLFSRI